MKKSLSLSAKIIIPLFIIGILTSFISFYYVNKVFQDVINDEVDDKVEATIDHLEDYVENEFKLLFYFHGANERTYKFKEKISKKGAINLLKKETKESKDIVYIITPDEIIQISQMSINKKLLKTIDLEKEIKLNSIKYRVATSYFNPWDWKIVLLHDISNFENILTKNQSFIFNITFILLGSLFILLILIFHFNVNVPLNILFNHLENISKGKYDFIEHKFDTKEFDTLSSYINVMSLSVEIREKDAKNLLAKTKENEDYIKDVLSSQENIILVIDKNEIKTANNAFFKLFSEFKNINEFKQKHKSISEYFQKDEDLIYDFEDKNWIEYVLNTKEKIHKVKIKQNNTEYTFALNAIKSQKYSRIIISLTDITELEKSNTLLSEYKKAVDAGTIVSKTDLNGKITYVNDKFLNISGYSHNELIGKDHTILRSPNMPENIYKNLDETIHNKQIWQGELESINKSGESYFVVATIVPILDADGEISEFLGIRYDITEQVNAKKNALKAEEAKGQFLANMSHEIRTPLNAIIGFTKILTNMNLERKTEKYVKTIDKSASNLLGIVNDVLDLSKIESGNLELEEIEFNPYEEFDSIINLFEVKIQEKNLELLYYIDPKLPQKIVGDPLRLKQVLSNLISNAIKFTKEGFISVRIELLEKSKNNCKIKFIIKDSGIGIEKEKQQQIFNAFAQADNSITREFGGTGLGLSISSSIIHALNSQINLISEINKGTQFDFNVEFNSFDIKNEQFDKFKEIKTLIYNEKMNQNKLFLPILKEYLTQISNNENNEELEKQDIVFVWEDSIDKGIEELKNTKVIVISKKEKEFKNLNNYISITEPINLSILFNILIETIDKSYIIPKKEDKTNFNNYNANILVVEDHEINQELITILLEIRGINYTIANNGQEAIDIFKKEKFDLILMDINMPIKNGIETTKDIIKYEKENSLEHTSIIALSANAIESEKQKALDVGMDDYLYKPLDEKMLDFMLKKYLKKSSQKEVVLQVDTDTFNIDKTTKELGLSSMIVKKLISKFCSSIDKDLKSLENAIIEKNYDDIKASAHKIKGASLNLRLNEISKYSLNIENNSHNTNFDYEKEFEKLKKATIEVKKSID